MGFLMMSGSFRAQDIKFWTMPPSQRCEPGASDLIDWFGPRFRLSFAQRIRRRNIEVMRPSSEILKTAIAASTKTLQSILDLEPQVTKAADLIADCLTNGKKIL